jgi:membrane protease YdiL (CAAX protease family)
MARRGSSGGEKDGEDTSFAIHHMLPQHYGGLAVAEFTFATPPEVDVEAASQPVNPGMPPLWHGSVPDPDTFRPIAPPLPGVMAAPPIKHAPPPVDRPGVQQPAPAPSVRPAAPASASPTPQAVVSEPYIVDDSPISAVIGPALEAFDPLYALALFLAAALGTWGVISDIETRYTALWGLMLLLGATLTLVDSRRSRRGVTSSNLLIGAGIAFLIGLPLLVFAAQGLRQTSILLYPYAKLPTLFQTMILLAPLGETVFFRGVLQERRGIIASVVGAGLGTLLFYWPAGVASDAVGVVVAVSAFLTVLAGLYSYVRQRYGLAAAYICQVVLNLLLLFAPRLVAAGKP